MATEENPYAPLTVHPTLDLFPLMTEAEITGLAESIKHVGLLVPIRITKIDETYYLIDGRCRWLALVEAGLSASLGHDLCAVLEDHSYQAKLVRWVNCADGLAAAHFVASMNLYRASYSPEELAEIEVAARAYLDNSKATRANQGK